LNEAARKQLEQIANMKQQIAADGREIQSLESQIGEVVSDQNRLRQNIESLNRVDGQQQQVQTYAQRLANQETELASLRDSRAELTKKRAVLEAEESNAIRTISF
jgi:regulator of replication initiation timing